MIPDRFEYHNHKYILLSKFRIDNAESCFGLYKQLSGCNYLVKDVMHSERKLKSNGLLHLCIASKGLHISDNKLINTTSFIEYFLY